VAPKAGIILWQVLAQELQEQCQCPLKPCRTLKRSAEMPKRPKSWIDSLKRRTATLSAAETEALRDLCGTPRFDS
jgi:hypothetical protein